MAKYSICAGGSSRKEWKFKLRGKETSIIQEGCMLSGFCLGFSWNESCFASYAGEHWPKEKWNCSYRFSPRCRDTSGPSQAAYGKTCELRRPLVIFSHHPFHFQKRNVGGTVFFIFLVIVSKLTLLYFLGFPIFVKQAGIGDGID